MQASARWIVMAVSGHLVRNDVSVAGSAMTDSRKAQVGSLYVARRGESAGGYAFVSGAAMRGAVVVIVEHGVDEAVTQVVVGDLTEALGSLTHVYVEKLHSGGNLDVIVMTGSAGKTTTKDLLLQTMSEDGSTVTPKLSSNSEIDLPLTALLANETTCHLVLEMGASGPGRIAYLTDIVALDAAIKPCVGHAYVGGFGGFKGVAAAKAELIKGIHPGGPVALNMDDPNVEAMVPLVTGRVIRFSASDNGCADVVVRDVRLDRAGRASFILVIPEGEAPVELKIASHHHVANALVVATGAFTLGVGPKTAASAFSHARALNPHRMDIHKLRVDRTDLALIDDSYNANLDSMRADIATLASIDCDSQCIAVLGEMLGLGEDSQSLHQQVGVLIADVEVGILVGLGVDTHCYPEEASKVPHREVVVDLQDAAWLILEHAEGGAVALVRGSFGSQS